MGRDRIVYVVPTSDCRKNDYGFMKMLFDLFMLLITCGLWAFVMIVREVRRLRKGC